MKVNILNKYPSQVVSKDGKRILCQARQKWVPRTPEERVRQAALNWLCEENGVPIEAIVVESRAGEGRADVIVYGEDHVPVLLVECKREDETLTDDVVDQAMDYANSISIDTIAVTNGKDIWAYLYDEKTNEYLLLTRVPAYEELSNSEKLTQYVDRKKEIWTRPRFEQLSDPLTQEHLECLGRDTPEHLRPFLSNLCCFFLDYGNRMTPQKAGGWYIEDLGCKYSVAKNPVGGWEGERRIFQVRGALTERNIGLAVMRQTYLKSEPNRTLGTVLVATVYESHKPRNCLQLRLDDDSVRNRGHQYTVSHKRGINHELLNFVEQTTPDLVKIDSSGKRVELGALDGSQWISWEQEATREFVANLIRYALLRDEFRREKSEIK
ncbi:MAG: type I restriction enzyme HsdR N-terminal domain-containing protein [Chloroflexi bacterium]|nr:type I restriction enzyme HsdR N-terminal domain-containing protein [Chloroflexota bacterium]